MNPLAAQREEQRFAEALRPAVMGPRLSVVTGSNRPCRVLDAKYEPGMRAELLYEQGGHLVRGDLVPGGQVPGDLVPGDLDAGTPAGGRVVVAPGVVLSLFPDDPDLPGLPAVMDPTTLRAAIPPRDLQAAASRGVRWRSRLVRYRPGKRATVAVGADGAAAYIAKVYHQERKAASVAAEGPHLLASSPARGSLRFAPVVGFVPDLRVVVQEVVGGVGLDTFLGGRGTAGRGLEAGLRRAARALAELHALPPVSGRLRPVDAELTRFAERAKRITHVAPAFGVDAYDLADRLARTEVLLPAPRLGTVHGDCKPSQFLLDEDRVWLIDLDHCGVSDQSADAGTFLATLRQLGVRHVLARRLPPGNTLFTWSAEVFLQEYLRGTGERDTARIQWQEAVALERKALRAFARAPRSPVPGALVREAHRCLDRLEEAA